MVIIMNMVKRRDCMSMVEWPSFQKVKVLKSPMGDVSCRQEVRLGPIHAYQ